MKSSRRQKYRRTRVVVALVPIWTDFKEAFSVISQRSDISERTKIDSAKQVTTDNGTNQNPGERDTRVETNVRLFFLIFDTI